MLANFLRYITGMQSTLSVKMHFFGSRTDPISLLILLFVLVGMTLQKSPSTVKLILNAGSQINAGSLINAEVLRPMF